jgi:hypothetical protein
MNCNRERSKHIGRKRNCGEFWVFVSMPLRHAPQNGAEGFRSRQVLDTPPACSAGQRGNRSVTRNDGA